MIDTPQITQTSDQQIASIRVTVPRAQIQEVMGPGFEELMSTVAAQGIAPTGPWFTHHFRMDPEIFDFEICVPVAQPVAPAGRVQPGRLPSATVARTIYHGGYEGLGDAWGEFDTWIMAQGRTPVGDLWESYTTGPESSPDPADWRTELARSLAG